MLKSEDLTRHLIHVTKLGRLINKMKKIVLSSEM